MNTNLLDLNNDVLNIIGDYVKKDNNERIQDDIVKETINIELPIGNLNVMQIATILNNYMINHV
jgi:hypothetical protein